jgi:hypothetical protein
MSRIINLKGEAGRSAAAEAGGVLERVAASLLAELDRFRLIGEPETVEEGEEEAADGA